MWYCTFNIHQNWVLTHCYHSKVMCCIFIHEKKSLSTNDNRIETLKMIYFASMFNEEGDDWYISKIIADKLNPIRYNINTVDLLLLVFVNCRASFVYNFTFKISFLNYKANCYHFGVKSFYGNKFWNCAIRGSTTPMAYSEGPKMLKKRHIFKNPLYSHTCEENTECMVVMPLY